MTDLFTDPEPYVAPEAPAECTVATATRDAIRARIEDAILNQPRSLQTAIGPSEIGMECDLCLGRRLAGVPKVEEVSWLPYIGTAVHSRLERVFMHSPRWRTETRLHIGSVGGEEIYGSCDLLDDDEHTVVDFKVVGASTLSRARKDGPSRQYRVQAHLYGLGWWNAGVPVDQVAICYLPRENGSLESGVWWAERFDVDFAEAALKRADDLAWRIKNEGADAVLPTLSRMPGCYDCKRYAKEET